MRKAIVGLVILLMLVACGSSEKISQETLNEFKVVDTEINELHRELVILKEEIKTFKDRTQNKTLVRLAQLQREYSIGTVKIQKRILTLEDFDVLVSSLVKEHSVLEAVWENVAEGHVPPQEFEILMWALFMDALEEEFKSPVEGKINEENRG